MRTDDMVDAAERCKIVAFTSPGGTGRTAALVNAACILVAAGKRVLIFDQGLDAPRVHDYLWRFEVSAVEPEDLLAKDLAMTLLGPVSVRSCRAARRYQLPMDPGSVDVIACAEDGAPQLHGGGHGAALGNQLRAAGYDYVLMDIAPGPAPATTEHLAYLCDTVVVCFHPASSEVSRAATLAREIAESVPFRLEILAVTLQFDDQDPGQSRQTKDLIRTTFTSLARPAVATTVFEIPYRPVGVVFDRAVDVLYDEPAALVPAAYARIAAGITGGQVDRMHPVSPRVRDSYRYALGAGALSAQPRIFLVYAAEDRRWADWIQSVLTSAGARVGRLPEDDSWLAGPVRPAVLIVGNPHLARSAAGHRAIRLTERTAGTPGVAARFDLLVVQVPGRSVSAPFDQLSRVNFVDCDETLARRRLLQHFVLFDRPDADTGGHPIYFPGAPAPSHSRSNLPPRNVWFSGRDAVLNDVRDRFLVSGEQVVCTLTGPAGTGKSQIALEYTHRFTDDYDLLWWIPAESERSIRVSLTELADEMKLTSNPDRPRAALDALRAHRRYQRWLLIYDNVTSLDTLAGLLPAGGTGHVLVTTHEPYPGGMPVGALDPDDGVELLRKLVSDLSAATAAQVAAQMELLPLALRLAAAWMSESAKATASRATAAEWAAAEFLARIARVRADQPSGAPLATSAVAIEVILGTLAETDLGRVATRLAELCSWLSADGVALRLLRSTSMVKALAEVADDGEAFLLDPLGLDLVLRCGQRYGLFEMNWERPAKLTMHAVLQELVRRAMAPEESGARRREVLCVLAAFAPTDPEPEDPSDIRDFVELQRHIEVSGAADDQNVSVRRWLVDQVNYLLWTESPEMVDFAIQLSTQALKGWNPTSRAERSLRTRLEFQLGALRMKRGEDLETLQRSVDALLDQQQKLLGPTHPRTLKSWRGRSGVLWRRGRFTDACAAEQRTLNGFREWLGDHHPDTRRSANNLAWSYFLAGDLSSALQQEEENYAIRMALFGPDHPTVWWSACSLGTYLRELGRNREAIKIFDEAVERAGALYPNGGHPHELRIKWQRAIAYRNEGDPSKALEESAETHRRFLDMYGSGHRNTVRCELSFAIDYHLTGNSDAAVCYAEKSLSDNHDPGAFYSHSALHQLNLAVFRRGLGQMAEAAAQSAEAMNELTGWLGADHPWTLAATINHAHVLALNEDPAAGELLRSAYEGCLEYLPPGHPYTRCAEGNLAGTVIDWGDVHVDLP